MSRMLDALKQIEAKRPQGAATVLEPVSGEELASFGLDRPAMPWSEAAEEKPMATEPPVAEEPVVLESAPVEEPVATIRIHAGSLEPAAEEAVDERDSAYGELAASILERCRTERPQALLFTSPGDREGKTSTLVPVAAVLAKRLGEEVLLIDANVRRPGVGRLLGLSPGLGLVDVLQEVVEWQDIVCKTDVPHLSVLPGSRILVEAPWPLDPLKFATLLAQCRRHYRLILLDTPSLLHPYAVPMAKHCEGAYLFIHLGHTGRRAIRQAVELLETNEVRLLGSVVVE